MSKRSTALCVVNIVRLGHRLGYRRMLAVGTVAFAAASVLCAVAPSAA